ncbi:MAG: ABC transporter permease [Ruminococcaceae bacterium]|nr:ABC transporter permease [Oscillospiraceae bacterium]
MNSKVNKKILRLSGVIALVFAGCALVVGLLEWIVWGIASDIDFIKAGERWSASGEPYAVISLYTEEGSALSAAQIEQYARSVDDGLASASVDTSGDGRVWTYAWSAEKVLNAKGPRTNKNAAVTVCGGDFFVFHPLKFIHGNGFLNDPSNPMGVVLDERLAWEIFGAVDVVGMEMSVGELPLVVVGIVSAERDSHAYEYTYGEIPRMYMSYNAYDKINGEAADITAYEVTLPNPVKGFAMNIFETAVSVNEDTTSLAESTERFSLTNRLANMKSLRYSFVRGDKIEYPYWENEARMTDHTCAVIMIFEVITASVGIAAFFLSFTLFFSSGFSFVTEAKRLVTRLTAVMAEKGAAKSNRLKPNQ